VAAVDRFNESTSSEQARASDEPELLCRLTRLDLGHASHKNSFEGVMMEPSAGRVPIVVDDDEISFLAIGSVLLRRRRLIASLTMIGAVLGLSFGLLRAPVYSSTAIFIPQGSEAPSSSSLALAASQFGIRVPTTGGGWGAPIYIEVLRSRGVLEPIALDTVTVAEQGSRRVTVMDLLDVKHDRSARGIDLTVRNLQAIINATEDKKIGAVRLTVTTRWPSVSVWLAEQLVEGVDEFNLKSRKSQAAEERRFVEEQAVEAERTLRAAEDRLQAFLQQNRSLGSPELVIERDRLGRDVSLRQQVYTSLLQNREEARIREVRDTPVITVLETPRLPVVGEPRGSVRKALLGGLAGGILGMLIAFLVHGVAGARRASSDDAREFFGLVSDLTPKFLRKHAS
jgi:uncharacterized protein involved in exopolysaccharide biosynthesis